MRGHTIHFWEHRKQHHKLLISTHTKRNPKSRKFEKEHHGTHAQSHKHTPSDVRKALLYYTMTKGLPIYNGLPPSSTSAATPSTSSFRLPSLHLLNGSSGGIGRLYHQAQEEDKEVSLLDIIDEVLSIVEEEEDHYLTWNRLRVSSSSSSSSSSYSSSQSQASQ